MLKQNFIFWVCSVLVLLTVTGCGASRQIKPEIKEKINSVEVILVFKNADLYAYGSCGGGYLPGVAGLVIDVGSQVAANEDNRRNADAIWPLVKALRPYSIPEKAKLSYQNAFKNVSWMQAKNWHVDKGDFPSYFKTTKASKYDAVMFIEIDYYLSINLKRLSVNSKISLYRNMGKKWDPQKVFFMTDDSLYDLSKQVNGLYDKHEIGKKLSENNAKQLHEKISKAFTKQAEYMVKKLDPPNDPEQSFSDRFGGGKVKTD